MIRTAMLIVTALSLQEDSASAQSVAGRWSGNMAPTAGQPTSIFVDLKISNGSITGRVSGPDLQRPGNIRKGSFDTRTGAVTFEVAVEGDNTIVNFDGKFANDSIAGRVTSNTNVSGTFSLGRADVPNLAAPASAVDSLAMAIQAGFAQVSGWVARAAQLVPPDKYTYRPVGTVRTFGQLLAHVVDGFAYYCGKGAGKNVQWSDVTEKGAVDKTTLATKLKQGADACSTAYTNPKQLPALMENIAHANLHYGNVITYMRMMGLVPPSS